MLIQGKIARKLGRCISSLAYYHMLCDRGHLLTEAFTAIPFVDFIRSAFPCYDVAAEWPHPAFKSTGGRSKQLDFVITEERRADKRTSSATKIEVAVEGKYLKDRSYTEALAVDLVRLALVSDAGQRLLIVVTRSAWLKQNLGTKSAKRLLPDGKTGSVRHDLTGKGVLAKAFVSLKDTIKQDAVVPKGLKVTLQSAEPVGVNGYDCITHVWEVTPVLPAQEERPGF